MAYTFYELLNYTFTIFIFKKLIFKILIVYYLVIEDKKACDHVRAKLGDSNLNIE